MDNGVEAEAQVQARPPLVYFRCVKERSRLRVRIISSGYNQAANCQFPRAIRVCGRKYSAPASDVTLARGPAGKYFYRVKKAGVEIVEEESEVKVKKVFEEEDPDCVVCMDQDYDVVIVPCGHYCLCKDCASIIQGDTGLCPICRGVINKVVTRDQIQT